MEQNLQLLPGSNYWSSARVGDDGLVPALNPPLAMEIQAWRSSNEGPTDVEEDNLSVTSRGVEGSSTIPVDHLRQTDLVSREEGMEEEGQFLQTDYAQHRQQALLQVSLLADSSIGLAIDLVSQPISCPIRLLTSLPTSTLSQALPPAPQAPVCTWKVRVAGNPKSLHS